MKKGNTDVTKKKIAWIVDSTVHMSERLKNHPDLFNIPLNIHFNEEQFADGIDLTTSELYQKIKDAKDFPKTSQPSAGEFAETYKEIAKSYDEAIAIHLSHLLSGTLASSKSGAEMAEFPVTFIDSLSLSYATTALVERGMELYENGASIEEIKKTLEAMAGTVENYILIGNLDQLYKGGRMSGMQFLVGSLLKIKPIIQISPGGELGVIDKVRSEKRATLYLIDKMQHAYDRGIRNFYIMHGNVLAQAKQLQQQVLDKMPEADVVIGEISSVLAVHAGEGTVAVLWSK